MSFSPDQAFQLIQKAHQNNHLAHAFLISGNNGDDLRSLAVRISALVNGYKANTIDDLKMQGAIVLEPESKLRRIKVDQIRELEKLLQRTNNATYKVGIIVDADRMMEQAANAFLKTLEEPPANSLLLLLSRMPEQLLTTILSRCVRVPLFRSDKEGIELTPEQTLLLEALSRHFSGKLTAPRASNLLRSFSGILKAIRDRIEKENHSHYRDEVDSYGKTTDGAWLKDREDYYEDLTESQYQEERSSLLTLLIVWFGEILRRQTGCPAYDLPGINATTEHIAKSLTQIEVHRRLRAVEELRKNLTTNVREALALEVGFLKAFG
jgi:DNA polymerase-3 subunit delta'